jgi:hypothetical protein
MKKLLIVSPMLVAAALSVGGCGRQASKPVAPEPPTPASAPGRKCPDPNIRDTKDPCSPYYWQPKGSALKNAKTF